MELTLFQSYLRRIHDATRFSQLVKIDIELTQSLLNSKQTNPVQVSYLREEIEMRSNPTVYMAMHRARKEDGYEPDLELDPAMEAGEDIDDGLADTSDFHFDIMDHISGNDDWKSSSLNDDDHIDDMVEKFTKQMTSEPYDESSSVGTEELAAKPGFMEIIEQVECEERGEFPNERPEIAKFLQSLANTMDHEGVATLVAGSKQSGLADSFTQDEKEMLNERVKERLQILAGVQYNIRFIQRRREARSMGLTLKELMEVRSKMAKKEFPLLFRSFLETIREEKEELSQLLGDGAMGDTTSEALDRIRERINEKTNQKIRDKKIVEDILDNLQPPDDKQRPKGPSR